MGRGPGCGSGMIVAAVEKFVTPLKTGIYTSLSFVCRMTEPYPCPLENIGEVILLRTREVLEYKQNGGSLVITLPEQSKEDFIPVLLR